MKRIRLIILILVLNSCSNETREFNNYLVGYTDLSPEKKNILISYYKNYVASIYEINIDGKLVKKLTKGTKDNDHIAPQYSPNGNNILFIKNTPTSTHLMIMNRDGTNLKEILLPDFDIQEAKFHPDNKRIFFIPALKNMYDSNNIYSINYDGSNLQKITHIKNGLIKEMKFIENGETIIFIYNDLTLNSTKKPEGIYSIQLKFPNKLQLEINTKTTENSKLPVDVSYEQIAISPNMTLACDAIYGTIHFFKKENGNWVKSRKDLKHHNVIFTIHFINDNELLYTENLTGPNEERKNILKLFDLNTEKETELHIDTLGLL